LGNASQDFHACQVTGSTLTVARHNQRDPAKIPLLAEVIATDARVPDYFMSAVASFSAAEEISKLLVVSSSTADRCA
jgi:hypothetical protein